MADTSLYYNITACASCGSEHLTEILAFGETALSDALLTDDTLNKPEITVPLTLLYCNNCTLLQIKEVVKPEVLFCNDYPYYSSVMPSLVAHFKTSATQIINKYELNKSSFVVEAACNDGILLQHFVMQGIPAVGIDPAAKQVEIAKEKGIDARADFFGKRVAQQLANDEHIQADIFLANNVLAHVEDLNGFIEGVAILLKPTGTAIIEVPYVKDTIEKTEFDQIFHQHLRFFSLHALKHAFALHGLYINDVEKVPIHGGTARLFVQKVEAPTKRFLNLYNDEVKAGLNTLQYYKDFAEAVEVLKVSLLKILDQLKAEGKTIAGYGAAGKANTMMHHVGIDAKYLDYIADISQYKQGKYFTGNRLPIVSPEYLITDEPDYVLILAWNFADNIMATLGPKLASGTHFIIPVPKPVII